MGESELAQSCCRFETGFLASPDFTAFASAFEQ